MVSKFAFHYNLKKKNKRCTSQTQMDNAKHLLSVQNKKIKIKDVMHCT